MLSHRSERGFANQVRDPHVSRSGLKPNRRVAYQDEAFRAQQHRYTPNLAAVPLKPPVPPPSLPSAGLACTLNAEYRACCKPRYHSPAHDLLEGCPHQARPWVCHIGQARPMGCGKGRRVVLVAAAVIGAARLAEVPVPQTLGQQVAQLLHGQPHMAGKEVAEGV